MTEVEKLASSHKWNMPTVCPVCGGKLEINESHTALYCTNEACKTKLVSRVAKWCQEMDIKEMADTTIEKFVDAKLIESLSDLYNLDYFFIEKMQGFGKKSADNIRKQIDAKREVSVSSFIAGYNIGGIGQKIAKKMVKASGAKAFEDIFSKKAADFVTDGIGSKTADKLVEGLAALKDDMLLMSQRVKVDMREVIEDFLGNDMSGDTKLKGKAFCFTGAFELDGQSIKRSDLEKMVTANGGFVKSSVSHDVDFLCQQDPNSNSTKSQKAHKLGIKIISPKEFMDIINEGL